MKYVLVIHGGAGTITRSEMTPEKDAAYRAALRESLAAGEAILAAGGSAVAAVEAAIVSMENSPLFNAGYGAVFTHEGMCELDASIMAGDSHSAGAVCGIKTAKHPISAARRVMEASEHVMLCGTGADAFVAEQGMETVPNEFFRTEFRYQQLLEIRDTNETRLDHNLPTNEKLIHSNLNHEPDKKFGTVGAVALDIHGNLAGGTSTGGMTNKRWGRVGDSPIIGAGTYADNASCAVSCTGHGEHFIRNVVAYDVSALMRYAGKSLEEAATHVVMKKLPPQDAGGGLIALDAQGNIAMPFNTEGMYRGFIRSGETPFVEIYK